MDILHVLIIDEIGVDHLKIVARRTYRSNVIKLLYYVTNEQILL